ncbi:MAG: AAA family ATPase [Actinobacteria bacterium]|nr:AAA family ATPase [Actinomycetota bacterium]
MGGHHHGEGKAPEGTVLAVCGKGGVGKTTVSALLARLFSVRKNGRVLLVDADPAVGLGMALSIFPERTVNDIREEIISVVKERATDSLDLAASVDYKLMQAVHQDGGMGFLSVGRPEDEGCYCQLNTLLREAIETLSAHFELTLIDAEAGVEQINRRVMRSVSHLLLVCDTTPKSLNVAETIRKVAEEAVNYRKLGLLVNRARGEGEARALAARSDLPLLGWIPEDETVREFDSSARSFLELPPCQALHAVEEAVLEGGFLDI